MHFFATAVDRLPEPQWKDEGLAASGRQLGGIERGQGKQHCARNVLKGVFNRRSHIDDNDLVGVETLFGFLRREAHKDSIIQGFLLRHDAHLSDFDP